MRMENVDPLRPIAYFCAEIALEDQIPTYAGGLGVLAGDFLNEAADQSLPVVAVSLYYHLGYVYPSIDKNGGVIEVAHNPAVDQSKLKLATDSAGERLIIKITIRDREVAVCAWKWQKGSVTVFLLDTDIDENQRADRDICNRLYDSDKEKRIEQEMVLGIGGLRLLEKIGIHPSIYHLNEGHSAFLVIELIRHEMDEHHLEFSNACDIVGKRLVFTSHTLVSSGLETYSTDLVSAMLYRYAEKLKVSMSDIISLGQISDSALFSLSILCLRMAGKRNAVSLLHAKKSNELWSQYPLEKITNGIYIPRWDKLHSSNVESIWQTHRQNKIKLLQLIAEKTGEEWDSDVLLLGWARRIVGYKRPLALFEDLERFMEIAQRKGREVRAVFSGKTHCNDSEGLELLKSLNSLFSGKLKKLAVFLPDYGLGVAELMVAGTDVWLNTPVVGFEACGTSGMKAALNGSLPLTTRDGWVNEIDLFKIGWPLEDSNINSNLTETLEKKVIPAYYTYIKNHIGSDWLVMMKNARELVLNQFGMNRVLKEYIEMMYSVSYKQSK